MVAGCVMEMGQVSHEIAHRWACFGWSLGSLAGTLAVLVKGCLAW